MAAKKARAKQTRARGKPRAVLFRLSDFPETRHAVAALDLQAVASAPSYIIDWADKPKMTIFEAIREPRVPPNEVERAFALVDALLDQHADARPPDEYNRGYHARATWEQAVARFEADGFEVVNLTSFVPPRAPRAAAASKARLARLVRALRNEVDARELARVAGWIEKGGAAPKVTPELAGLVANLVIDESLETYGPIEDRAFELAARHRRLAGLAEKRGDRDADDRTDLFADRLAKAGWSADEIADAWLDRSMGDHFVCDWHAMKFLSGLAPLVRRILARTEPPEPTPALARLLAAPIRNLPDDLIPFYKAAVRRVLASSGLAGRLGPQVCRDIADADDEDKALVRAASAARGRKPVRTTPERPAPVVPKAAPATVRGRLAIVKDHYRVDLPEEVLEVWDLASSLSPRDPCSAFANRDYDIGLTLLGPFDLLAGRTRLKPGLDMRLHYRYRGDPPEFLTLASGNEDLFHLGYWFDDLAAAPACVASWYAADAFDLSVPGRTLWEAIRFLLERSAGQARGELDGNDRYFDEIARFIARLGRLRDRIKSYATADRTETGEAYTLKYELRGLRARLSLAETPEGMGVVAPARRYRPLKLMGNALRNALETPAGRKKVVAEALALARRGFPASAVVAARYCWARDHHEEAYRLFDAGYAGLGRTGLRELAALHRAHRDLESVDVLAAAT